jgi:hypothetical protein
LGRHGMHRPTVAWLTSALRRGTVPKDGPGLFRWPRYGPRCHRGEHCDWKSDVFPRLQRRESIRDRPQLLVVRPFRNRLGHKLEFLSNIFQGLESDVVHTEVRNRDPVSAQLAINVHEA